jgi:hypothetical protein
LLRDSPDPAAGQATSARGHESEQLVQQALDSDADRTTLVIAHHSPPCAGGRIVVLEDGHVVIRQGTHNWPVQAVCMRAWQECNLALPKLRKFLRSADLFDKGFCYDQGRRGDFRARLCR